MKKGVLTALLVVLALAATTAVVWADPTEWHVYHPASIQAAVDGASDGDIIYVHTGTYDEAITINGTDLSLIAVGSVTLAPSSCTGHGDVISMYDAVATIDGFEVDASACASGIYARGCSWLGEGPVDVTVRNNNVHSYFKNGITVNCDLASGAVANNTVTGIGYTEYVAQNGIQFGYGATGHVMRNVVNLHWYIGPDWASSGILVFESDEVTVQRNTISDCQTAVAVETWSWYEPSASYNRVTANTIDHADWGVSVAAYDWAYSSSAPSADNNKVVNNVITSGGEVGVSVGAWDLDNTNSYVPSANNNKVIHNTIEGYTLSIDNQGSASKIHANVLGP